ncbi:MAG: endolytic transglycosylase MltG [Candidatus Moranbacteria bacterium]|nr:endolytic transglycosylase MltG [Candidatus Moranbacteria bacterium]
MPKSKIVLAGAGLFFVLILSEMYIFNREASFSHGSSDMGQLFEVKSGKGIEDIGQDLENAQLIRNRYYFDYYIWKTDSKGKIKAGKYELQGSMTIPEIVQVLSIGEIESNQVKITFPEGLSSKEMAEKLDEKGFSGDDFLSSAKLAGNWTEKYDFLETLPKDASLEGFLFPDTYIFFKDAKAESIAGRMLDNFGEKLTPEMRADIGSQGKSIYQVITMASILEKEVKTPEDMKIVSGIFWDRIDAGMPLQSCATIAYALGKEKKQYSLEDTKTQSPYNTYLNKGLPPGPIDNPGTNAIQAAIYPTKTDYVYFLTDPAGGTTVFSKTLEEHAANKAKYGL